MTYRLVQLFLCSLTYVSLMSRSRYLLIVMLQAGSCYPGSGSGEDKAVSVGDLSQSTDTLLRSHKPDTVIWEEAAPAPAPATLKLQAPAPAPSMVKLATRAAAPAITASARSQSLNEVRGGKKVSGSSGGAIGVQVILSCDWSTVQNTDL